MPNVIIPVSCPNCGALFSSRAIAISGNIRGLHLSGNKESCPRCGGMAEIVDGVFNVADGALSMVSGPNVTKHMLAALEVALRTAVEKKTPADDVAREVEKIDPSFGDYVRKLGKNKPLFVTGLLIALAAIKACTVDVKVDVKLDANRLIDQLTNVPPAVTSPQHPDKNKPPGLGKNYTLRHPE